MDNTGLRTQSKSNHSAVDIGTDVGLFVFAVLLSLFSSLIKLYNLI